VRVLTASCGRKKHGTGTKGRFRHAKRIEMAGSLGATAMEIVERVKLKRRRI
jgi:hypothetical protein